MGNVTDIKEESGTFEIKCRSGDEFWVCVGRETQFRFLQNLDGVDRDRIPTPEGFSSTPSQFIKKYIQRDRLVVLQGVYQESGDIKRTVRTFNDFFLDRESEYGYGDYFSHLDYATMSWDSNALGDNYARKNWNSIGDHIPAYLINLILAIEPLPITDHGYEDIRRFLDICKKILNTTSKIIVDRFPDPDPNIPFVNERFLRDWKQDKTWRWQQDRAVVR